MRRWSLESILASTQLGIGVLALVAIGVPACCSATRASERHVSIFYSRSTAWRGGAARLQAGVAIAIMLPPALLMGLSFPIASLVLLRRGGAVSAPVGRAALLSNLGSIFGSISAAVLTLPLLGTVGGTRAIARSAALGSLRERRPGPRPGARRGGRGGARARCRRDAQARFEGSGFGPRRGSSSARPTARCRCGGPRPTRSA
jgi:hypothetical protein